VIQTEDFLFCHNDGDKVTMMFSHVMRSLMIKSSVPEHQRVTMCGSSGKWWCVVGVGSVKGGAKI
jgi:hypothetical protein